VVSYNCNAWIVLIKAGNEKCAFQRDWFETSCEKLPLREKLTFLEEKNNETEINSFIDNGSASCISTERASTGV
jgi:hypothetical protein